MLLTVLLNALRDVVGLPTELMLFLALTVLVALIGGLWPAVVSAVAGFVLLNWFFTVPTGMLTIAEPENALALGVFLLVAAGVAVGRRPRGATHGRGVPGPGGGVGPRRRVTVRAHR